MNIYRAILAVVLGFAITVIFVSAQEQPKATEKEKEKDQIALLSTKLVAKDSQLKALRAQLSIALSSLNTCMTTIGNMAIQDPIEPPTTPVTESN